MPEFKKIPSQYLVHSDIPPEGADWHAIVTFASTFDIDVLHYGKLPSTDLSSIDDTMSLDELRSHLFYQWRRWNHFGRPPELVDMAGIQRLIERIRAQVTNT